MFSISLPTSVERLVGVVSWGRGLFITGGGRRAFCGDATVQEQIEQTFPVRELRW